MYIGSGDVTRLTEEYSVNIRSRFGLCGDDLQAAQQGNVVESCTKSYIQDARLVGEKRNSLYIHAHDSCRKSTDST